MLYGFWARGRAPNSGSDWTYEKLIWWGTINYWEGMYEEWLVGLPVCVKHEALMPRPAEGKGFSLTKPVPAFPKPPLPPLPPILQP